MSFPAPHWAYSVVIPAHDEADNLPPLLAEIRATLDPLGRPYEIVVVDDGSTDATLDVLKAEQRRGTPLTIVKLDGNFGQSAAFEAGFQHARGDVFITLDADGQNPPSEIPVLLAGLDQHDMVCGWRHARQDTWIKRITSRCANILRTWLLADPIHDTGCSLKVMRREVVARFKLFHGMHRFLPALARLEGFRVGEAKVAHRPRTRGTSHYGFHNRLFSPIVDLLVVSWMRNRVRTWRIAEVITTDQPATTPWRIAG